VIFISRRILNMICQPKGLRNLSELAGEELSSTLGDRDIDS